MLSVNEQGLRDRPGRAAVAAGRTDVEGKYGSGNEVNTSEITQLENWACALGNARNAMVHGEELADHEYEAPGSPYNGPLVEVGDRIVRELITVSLGGMG